jgi:hypothetical protein
VNLTLIRHAYMREATLGFLLVGDQRFATLEESWKADPDGPGGQRREGVLVESCVPDGIYSLEPHDGTKFRDVWVMVNPRLGVYRSPAGIPAGQKWGRSAVLIHSGNSTADIEGCCVVGKRHGIEQNKPWVYESRAALDQLRDLLVRGTVHTLTIRPTAGTLEL